METRIVLVGLLLAGLLGISCSGESSAVPTCAEFDRQLSKTEGPRLVLCEDAEGNRIERRLPATPATPSVQRSG